MSETLEIFIMVLIIAIIIVMFLMYSKLGKFLDSARQDINRLIDEIDALTNDVTEVKQKVNVTIEIVNKITDKTSQIVSDAQTQLHKVYNAAEPYYKLANDVYEKIAPPAKQTAGMIAGFFKGLNTFFSRVSQKDAQ